jgi:prepilin-type N-terminal cleavage/methylation domain-containing protein
MEANRSHRGGFTLIEILIVITIISILASLTTAGILRAQVEARRSVAMATVAGLTSAVEEYFADTGRYPGAGEPGDGNQFPALHEALAGLRPPRGNGGPSAPYMEFKQADLLVIGGEEGYRRPNFEEIRDPKVPKYLADPWGHPYVYLENRSRIRPNALRLGKADIYSMGRDGIDSTALGDEGDDIGNW